MRDRAGATFKSALRDRVVNRSNNIY